MALVAVNLTRPVDEQQLYNDDSSSSSNKINNNSGQQQQQQPNGDAGAQQKQIPTNCSYSDTSPAALGGKVLINPIAAYSQQLADKQLHIARVTDDAVHWRRDDKSEDNSSLGSTTRRRSGKGYIKDSLASKFNISSGTALSGGMLERELDETELREAAAKLTVGDTSKLDNGQAYGAKIPEANGLMYPIAVHTSIKPEAHAHAHVDRAATSSNNANGIQSLSTVSISPESLSRTSSRRSYTSSMHSTSEATTSRTPSAYGTPTALAPTPDPLSKATTTRRSSTTTPQLQQQQQLDNNRISQSLDDASTRASSTYAEAEDGQSIAPSTAESTSSGFPFSKEPTLITDSEGPKLFIASSTTLSRQQQDKATPPPLSALNFLPQANVIPPTPPTASTSASFPKTTSPSTSISPADRGSPQQLQPSPLPPLQSRSTTIAVPKSPKTPSSPILTQAPLYLSPESIRKSSPSHKRSQSYQPAPTSSSSSHNPARTSFSNSIASTSTAGAPPPSPSASASHAANRRMSLLPPITTSTASNSAAETALRKRSMSPRRALSFRGSGSGAGTALPTPGGPVYDEPVSMEEAVEQQRQADQLNETIARQAEQIRKERLSKRIETQRAHERALAALRDEKDARQGRGEDTGASALVSGSPPTRDSFMSSQGVKGKERERGDTTSTNGGNASPTSPVSVHKQLWSTSPVAGEKAVLRGSGGEDISSAAAEKAALGGKEKSEVPERVLVGNLIGEDHVNYVLMYNMLTGIRIGVSRCEAKISRPLTDADYTAQHKFSFDIVGNELTPSARYDFKFKDYAPWVFRELRAHFHLDPADYLLSLTSKYILSELGSPGKSGSFFYFSRDYRFIIKTISHTEHKFLRNILKHYHKHVLDNPNTLISRFYGLHRVKLPHGRKIHFVIMNNLFPPHRDIHETYDLKGSSIGREYPEAQAAVKPRATLKDLNWIHRHRQIEFGPSKRMMFEDQLKRDVDLLQRMKIMDYSLLIGIHDMSRGNSENLRDGMLTVFQPEGGQGGKLRRRPTHRGDLEREHTAAELRKAVQRADPQTLSNGQLPQKDQSERKYFVFYQDEGGIRATDEYDRNEKKIYYLGVIDILTPYNWKKKIEHCWRSMQYDKHRISAVPPKEYGDRFLGFLIAAVRGGDQSKKPKME